jgi:uncharacterized NAD(P)/FAD-binding protein YdhS
MPSRTVAIVGGGVSGTLVAMPSGVSKTASDDARPRHRALRGGSSHYVRVNRVINCTAPESDYRKLTHPLWRNLLARGTVVAGPCGLGLRTGPDGELVSAGGESSRNLFTLGPTRIGTLFETTSVEEIRVQARAVAARIHGLAGPSFCEVARPELFSALNDVAGKHPSVAS